MASPAYRLPDEPLPTGFAKFAVDPMWPLLASMFAGSGVGMTWFILNSVALGSPTRAKEVSIAVASALGSVLLLLLIGYAERSGWLAGAQLRYAALSIVALKLTMAYLIYLMQARCFEIWEHYGNRAVNGLPALLVLALFARRILQLDQWPQVLAVMAQ